MTYRTSGLRVVSATSKAAKTVPTWNPKTSWVGSGLPTGKRCRPLTKYLLVSVTTHGLPPDTKSKDSRTMLNSTLTVKPIILKKYLFYSVVFVSNFSIKIGTFMSKFFQL